MSFTGAGRVAITTNDVVTFQRCPWAWVNNIAVALDRAYPAPALDEPMRRLMGATAEEHRQRVTLFAMDVHGAVAMNHESPLTEQWDSSNTLIDAVWRWSDAYSPFDIEARANVLVAHEGKARITMAKLGHSSMKALHTRSAGGIDGLVQLGIEAESEIDVAFADGTMERASLVDAREAWRETLSEMAGALQLYRDGAPLDWSDTPFDQCGRLSCEWCQDALSRNDDLFHIARIRRTQRKELRRHGITTTSEFVAETAQELCERVGAIPRDDMDRLHIQASVQALSPADDGPVAVEVISPRVLAELPPVRSTDVYLDFEADPSYHEWQDGSRFEPGASGPDSWIGLEYLIGVLESGSERYRSWWADSFAQEADAFRAFIDELGTRHRADADFRVYHYAPYEVQALNRLSERHGYGQEIVASLVDAGILVDLYKVVMNGVAIGSPSYSLKRLEALYFSGNEREGITQGVDSVMAFSRYRENPEKSVLKNAILEYNRVDCLSTKRLHQWLMSLHGN